MHYNETEYPFPDFEEKIRHEIAIGTRLVIVNIMVWVIAAVVLFM